MKRLFKTAAGIAVALTLGAATAALAQPGPGYGPGPCARDGTQQGTGPGTGPGWRMGAGPAMGPGGQMRYAGRMGPGARGPGFGNPLMTAEERVAHRDRMLKAATPEERQEIATAMHAEMQKRAAEKGATVPQQRFGPGAGPRFRQAPQAPAEAQ